MEIKEIQEFLRFPMLNTLNSENLKKKKVPLTNSGNPDIKLQNVAFHHGLYLGTENHNLEFQPVPPYINIMYYPILIVSV